MIIEAVLLGIGGATLLTYHVPLATLMYQQTQLPFVTFARELGLRWVDGKTLERWLVKLNRVGLIFGGVVLVLMAFAAMFGPISL
jgi:hypothetical protein